MFTLKLYQNGPLPGVGRTAIIELAGVWINHCDHGIKEIVPFRKKVGVQDRDEDYMPSFYVGGDREAWDKEIEARNQVPTDRPDELKMSQRSDYYGWGVLENAQGKTTEMFR